MRFWLIGTGSEYISSIWRKNSIIAIDFEVRIDLSALNKNEIESYLASVGRDSIPNVKACNDFVHNMKIGDIVVVRRGSKEIVGICRILTGYIFDAEPDDCRNIRSVDWINTERQVNPDSIKFPRKTLLDFTDQRQRPRLKKYVLEKIDQEQKVNWATSPPVKTEYSAIRKNQIEGYVYVIGLDAYPGKFKIGHANDVEIRVRELGVAVPEPFTVFYYEFFRDSAHAESEVHNLLKQFRLRGEWFERDLNEIAKCIDWVKENK